MERFQPKLRFPEFKEKWELATFNHFFKIGSSKRVLQDNWQSEGIPFYRTRELVKLSNNEEIKNDIYIKEDLYNDLKEKYGVPQIGDILVSGVGTLGISYIIENLNPFYFKDGNVIWFKKIKNIDSKFFNYIFQNDFVQNQISDNASITTVGTFTIDNANKTKFYYSTKIEEQTKIANFLSSVDEKLNLLKEKKELLEDYKKGILQKIFNQEIRFKDDNGNDFEDWSETSLGDIGSFKVGGDLTKLDYQKEKSEVYKYPIYANGAGEGIYGYAKTYQYNSNCVTVSGRGNLGYANSRTEKFNAIVRLIVIEPNANICPKFLEEVINQIDFAIESTGVPQLTAPQIKNYSISVPSLKEQTKIANFLSAIDEKIKLVTNQIQDTQEYKKGLLQQMFV
jgi:type I restriction enzyme S subunit